MKRLLVLGAGILQVPVIKKAHEMGFYVIAADDNINAIGFQYADKRIVPEGLTSEEKMLTIARKEKIDGVIHPCSEIAMMVMGRINDEMGLAGISYKTAICATNKPLMRKSFERGYAPSPKSILTTDVENAWQIFCHEFPTNAILKPSRNSGSRGISKVEKNTSKDEFGMLYKWALEESRDNSVLIEQFIEGPEFSVEVIIWNGHVNVLAITDKKTTGAPHFVELGHNQPSTYPEETQLELKKSAVLGVKALGLNNCAAHCELKMDNGKAYLMEIGARLGGDFISTELVHLSTGIDMVGAAVNVALGLEPDLKQEAAPQGVCIRYFTPQPGILKSIKNVDILKYPYVYDAEIYPNIGDKIREVKSSLDRSGHVIVTAKTAQEAICKADDIVKNLTFVIDETTCSSSSLFL